MSSTPSDREIDPPIAERADADLFSEDTEVDELREEVEPDRPAQHPLLRRAAIVLLGAVAAALLAGVAAYFLIPGDADRADPGRLDEVLYSFGPAFGPMPAFAEVTSDWGFGAWRHTGTLQMSGGAAIDDLDRDGHADVVAAGGDLNLFFGNGNGFDSVAATRAVVRDDVTGVGAADVDLDGWPDILVAQASGDDAIIWGGAWARARRPEEATVGRLPGGDPTASWLAADVTGDRAVDLVRLGYGSDDAPAADLVLVATSSRNFDEHALPGSDRFSLAAELVDLTGDGVAEIWVTRDTGWRTGGDSIYSFDPETATWRDLASSMSADLEIDGMGVTVADLNGDDRLDAYLSDVGENELLVGAGRRFTPLERSGAGRIRPPGAARDLVSSSWGTGAADFNLDGRLDLVVANGGFKGRDVVNKVDRTRIAQLDSPALFLGDGRGRFTDVWPARGASALGRHRGIAVGDLDSDGDSDIVLLSHGEGLRLYRNDSRGRSLTMVPGPPCTGAGAAVRVQVGRAPPMTSVLAPHTFLGSHAQQLIVGTNKARTARVEVRWPGGGRETELIKLNQSRTRVTLQECRTSDVFTFGRDLVVRDLTGRAPTG